MTGEPERLTRPIVPIRHQLKTVDEIKEAMIDACHVLDVFGLVQGMGHVSSRLPNSTNILVTPKKPLGLVRKKDLILLDSNGKMLEGHGTPFGEINMHLGIYRKRPDAGAICRFHGEMISVFGVLKRPIKVVYGHCYVLGPEVRVLDSTELRMTPELVDEMGELLTDAYGILFRGNGAATFGTNVIDACVRAVYLEESARLQYKAALLGEPTFFSIADINRRNETYWDMPDYDVYWRSWEFYKSRINRPSEPLINKQA